MANFSVFLMFFFTLVLVIGLIKPEWIVRWDSNASKKEVFKAYVIGIVLSTFFTFLASGIYYVFTWLRMIFLLAFIVGLINPDLVIKWGDNEKKTRVQVLKCYGILQVVFFIISLSI